MNSPCSMSMWVLSLEVGHCCHLQRTTHFLSNSVGGLGNVHETLFGQQPKWMQTKSLIGNLCLALRPGQLRLLIPHLLADLIRITLIYISTVSGFFTTSQFLLNLAFSLHIPFLYYISPSLPQLSLSFMTLFSSNPPVKSSLILPLRGRFMCPP